MNKNCLIAIFLCISACSSGGAMISMNSFYDIPIGASHTEVVSSLGKPYSVKRNDDGSEEYEYIERVKIGARSAEERHYYLQLKDGKVTSKKVKQSSPGPYLFDSYEMQTTQLPTTENEDQKTIDNLVK
jgi:hypothetical protein